MKPNLLHKTLAVTGFLILFLLLYKHPALAKLKRNSHEFRLPIVHKESVPESVGELNYYKQLIEER